jgi:hypothetical protein
VLKKRKEPSSSGHYSRDEVLERLNLFQDIVDIKLGNLLTIKDSSLTTVSGTASYKKPTTVRSIDSIYIDSAEIKIVTESELQRDSLRGNIASDWQDETGDPKRAYEVNDYIYLWPIPDTSDLTIYITGKGNLTAMTDSSVSYPLNNMAHVRVAQLLLVYYVQMDLATDDGDSNTVSTVSQLFNSILEPITTITKLKKRRSDPTYMGEDNEETE